ncbi:MAG: DJ-1 family glyoxalase III [Anaerocolumna sp.]
MVYLFLAEGFEEIEALTVVDLLRRAEIDITTVSITGHKKVTGSHQIIVEADDLYENANYKEAGMLVLPGGMPGTKHLGEHEALVQLLKEFHSQDKNIAAICAAPSVLGANGILKGKKATCYPGFEDKLIDAIYTGSKAEEDGNIITGKGMGTAIDFSLKIIEKLRDKSTAEKIAASIQYV